MLKFSYNWNNKLSCKYFSTIRLFSQKFQVGSFYAMDYKGSRREVECVYKQPIKLKDIPDYVFRDAAMKSSGLQGINYRTETK